MASILLDMLSAHRSGTWAAETYQIREAAPTEREMGGEMNELMSDSVDSHESL